jgi:hypothetical protein
MALVLPALRAGLSEVLRRMAAAIIAIAVMPRHVGESGRMMGQPRNEGRISTIVAWVFVAIVVVGPLAGLSHGL